jgi:UDP-glucose 4-epimerase
MKKVLIVGGLGFIGSNLAKKYVSESNTKVTVLDNLDERCGGNICNIETFKDKVEYLNIDILEHKNLKKIISDKDIIINCAAISSHSISMEDPWGNLRVNVGIVLMILECMKSISSPSRLIQIGTTTQTGLVKTGVYAKEDHFESPVDIYSANKLIGEKYTNIYSASYGLDVINIRLSNIYGPRAGIHSPKLTFNNYFIGLALQNKTINVYSPGTQLRNSLYIEDAVEAIFMAGNSDKAKNETLQVVSDEHLSVLEIAEKTASIIGGSVCLTEWPNKNAQDIGNVKFSNNKTKSILGWKPIYTIDEGLLKTKEYFSKNLKKYL